MSAGTLGLLAVLGAVLVLMGAVVLALLPYLEQLQRIAVPS